MKGLPTAASSPPLELLSFLRKAVSCFFGTIYFLEVPKRDIRRLICYEKASLEGVPVYEVKDRMAKLAWQDYLAVGKEILP